MILNILKCRKFNQCGIAMICSSARQLRSGGNEHYGHSTYRIGTVNSSRIMLGFRITQESLERYKTPLLVNQ